MDLHTWLIYLLAATGLSLSPGPNGLLALTHGALHGRRKALYTIFGGAFGFIAIIALSMFGIGALLKASLVWLTVMKWIGGAYLIWLAVATLRHGAALKLNPDGGAAQPLVRVFLTGLGINLLNPKIVVFFLTFLPQFVSANDPHAGAQLMFLGLYFIALGIPTCAVSILAAERFTAAIRRSPRAMRAIDYLFAGLMGAFAVRLLFARAD